jgi:hypothetical protein
MARALQAADFRKAHKPVRKQPPSGRRARQSVKNRPRTRHAMPLLGLWNACGTPQTTPAKRQARVRNPTRPRQGSAGWRSQSGGAGPQRSGARRSPTRPNSHSVNPFHTSELRAQLRRFREEQTSPENNRRKRRTGGRRPERRTDAKAADARAGAQHHLNARRAVVREPSLLPRHERLDGASRTLPTTIWKP